MDGSLVIELIDNVRERRRRAVDPAPPGELGGNRYRAPGWDQAQALGIPPEAGIDLMGPTVFRRYHGRYVAYSSR